MEEMSIRESARIEAEPGRWIWINHGGTGKMLSETILEVEDALRSGKGELFESFVSASAVIGVPKNGNVVCFCMDLTLSELMLPDIHAFVVPYDERCDDADTIIALCHKFKGAQAHGR